MVRKKPTKSDFLLAWAQALPEGAHFGPAIWNALGPLVIARWMYRTRRARR